MLLLQLFSLPHRFAAAFFAISVRLAELSFAARAFPPFFPPRQQLLSR